MSTAKRVKRNVRHLAEEAEDRIDEAHEELDEAIEETGMTARNWASVLAVAGIALVGLMLLMRRRRASRLERGAHLAVDKAFRLSNEARDSARDIAERGSRLLSKMPRLRVEMP